MNFKQLLISLYSNCTTYTNNCHAIKKFSSQEEELTDTKMRPYLPYAASPISGKVKMRLLLSRQYLNRIPV